MKVIGQVSRRGILKGAAALGATGVGFAPEFDASRAWAAGEKLTGVNILNAAGSLSLVQAYMFKDLKLFEKYGVEPNLINVSDGNKILAGLVSGDGDICGGSGFSSLLPAIEKGAKVKILSGAGIAPLSILYSNRPEIKSVKDLPGRTVGVGAIGANLHQLVVAVLKKYGVDYTKVTFANIGGTTDIFKGLVGGTIDAGVAPIEFRDSADKYKLHPIADGLFYEELPLYMNQAIYASDSAIAEKRQGLIGVMAAYADLFRWMGRQDNKQAFIEYYRKALDKSSSDEESVFFQNFLSQPGRLATDLVITEDKIKFVQDLNIELGVQKRALSFDEVADMSLAKDALKLLKS